MRNKECLEEGIFSLRSRFVRRLILLSSLFPVFRIHIRIRRIHMFLGLPDPHPDPLVRDMDPDSAPDPDPSIVKQK
jgi:hypothetical protein